MPVLRTQIGRGALSEARRLAHSLRGASASLEVAGVALVAGEIEAVLEIGDLRDIEHRLARLDCLMAPAIAAASRLSATCSGIEAPGMVRRRAPRCLKRSQICAVRSPAAA